MKCAQTVTVHSQLTFVNVESDIYVFYCQCECYIEFTKNPLISNDSFAIYYVNIALRHLFVHTEGESIRRPKTFCEVWRLYMQNLNVKYIVFLWLFSHLTKGKRGSANKNRVCATHLTEKQKTAEENRCVFEFSIAKCKRRLNLWRAALIFALTSG